MTPSSTSCRFSVAILATCTLFAGVACDQLSARRDIQKGDKLYEEGKYDEAIEKYEDALEKADLATGHHNAAIAAYKAFQPGIDTEANRGYADTAMLHFKAYLESHPNDEEIIGLLTNVWLDSEAYDEALAYWHDQLDERPDDREVLERLGTINRQAGNYEKALEWDYKRADIANDSAHKVKAYLDIAGLQYSRLNKAELVDDERLAVADEGIAALQKALELAPDSPDVLSLLGTLYQYRAPTHYSTWARVTESASQRYFQVKRNEIAASAKKTAASGGPTPAEPESGSPEEE